MSATAAILATEPLTLREPCGTAADTDTGVGAGRGFFFEPTGRRASYLGAKMLACRPRPWRMTPTCTRRGFWPTGRR